MLVLLAWHLHWSVGAAEGMVVAVEFLIIMFGTDLLRYAVLVRTGWWRAGRSSHARGNVMSWAAGLTFFGLPV